MNVLEMFGNIGTFLLSIVGIILSLVLWFKDKNKAKAKTAYNEIAAYYIPAKLMADEIGKLRVECGKEPSNHVTILKEMRDKAKDAPENKEGIRPTTSAQQAYKKLREIF